MVPPHRGIKAVPLVGVQFVAHPNCQQHMTSIWYGSEMGFLQSLNGLMQFFYLVLFIPIIPFLCVIYVFVPGGKVMSFPHNSTLLGPLRGVTFVGGERVVVQV